MLTITTLNNRVEATRKTARLTRAVGREDTKNEREEELWQRSYPVLDP